MGLPARCGQREPGAPRRLLQDVLDEGTALLRTFPAGQLAFADNPDLELAERAVQRGAWEEAVELAHQAQRQAPDDPAVFRRMIDVHIQAADACTSDEDALRWLECAYNHDPSGKVIHQRLAQRYRAWARRLLQLRRDGEAHAAVRRSLQFEPFHDEMRAMLAQLEAESGTSNL